MTYKISFIWTLFIGSCLYCVSTANAFQPAAMISPALASHLMESETFARQLDNLSKTQLIPGYHDLDPRDQYDVAPRVHAEGLSEFQLPHYYIRDVRNRRKIA